MANGAVGVQKEDGVVASGVHEEPEPGFTLAERLRRLHVLAPGPYPLCDGHDERYLARAPPARHVGADHQARGPLPVLDQRHDDARANAEAAEVRLVDRCHRRIRAHVVVDEGSPRRELGLAGHVRRQGQDAGQRGELDVVVGVDRHDAGIGVTEETARAPSEFSETFRYRAEHVHGLRRRPEELVELEEEPLFAKGPL